MKLRQLLICLLVCILLSGCTVIVQQSHTDVLTSIPSSTWVVTVTPGLSTLRPSVTSIVVTDTLAKPAAQVQVTSTPSPSVLDLLTCTLTSTYNLRDDQIFIVTPGELSRITTPIQLVARLLLDRASRLRLELREQDGRLLFRQISTLNGISIGSGILATPIDFEIALPEELSRLYLRLEDAVGLPLAVNSIELVLANQGINILQPVASQPAILIKIPESSGSIHGGTLTVSGVTRLFQVDHPLRVQLITPDGGVVGQRLVEVSQPFESGLRMFTAEVPYFVSKSTTARLVVFEEDRKTSQITHLTSLEITLLP